MIKSKRRTSLNRSQSSLSTPLIKVSQSTYALRKSLNTKTIIVVLILVIALLSLYWSILLIDEPTIPDIDSLQALQQNYGNIHNPIHKTPKAPNIQKPPQFNEIEIPHPKDIKQDTQIPPKPEIENNENLSKLETDTTENEENLYGIELSKAIDLSLNGYILRDGHNKRVEYMIGFRLHSKVDDTSKLSPRNSKPFDRDYNSRKISIRGWIAPPNTEYPCDIPCGTCHGGGCDILGLKWSMENVGVSEQDGYISGSTKLNSQCPVPYFSWHDFGFMVPLKTPSNPSYDKHNDGDGIAAAFISNCGFSKRNNMVTDLQKYGVIVHSFGRCMHNKDENRDGGRDQTKINLLSTYKFSLAFENSETDDYITEKFFGTLSSGSVPVYIGAPNVKFFAPDVGPWPYETQHSVIWAGDFDFDAQKLAKYLLYLDSNDTAYNEYLSWKVNGYSGDFKALVELTSTHTACRQCVFGGDSVRIREGSTEYDNPLQTFVFGNGKKVYVRERGGYRFTLIQLESNTIDGLVSGILRALKKRPVKMWTNNDHPDYSRIGPAVYGIYHIPTKNVIHSNDAVDDLQDYVELECILI